MHYETLLDEAHQQDIEVYEQRLSKRIKGLYSNHVIWINKQLSSNTEKACVLAEEIGHHHKTAGDILDQSNTVNKKQELIARTWAYTRLVPLNKLARAIDEGITSRYELANYLGVTEDFLYEALKRYKDKYGLFTTVDEFVIYFEPLAILKTINHRG